MYKFCAATDLAVLGYNPEMADMDNPLGAQIGFAAYVYAENRWGFRYRLFVNSSFSEFEVLAEAQDMAEALQTRQDSLGKLPVGFQNWEEASPAYGSRAFLEAEADGLLGPEYY